MVSTKNIQWVEEILHQLRTLGNYETVQKMDYNGINHPPTGVGFLPSTVAFAATMINIYIYIHV